MAGDRTSVQAHGVHHTGVQAVAHDAAGVAQEDEHTHDLHAAAGGTGHTAADGEYQQHEDRRGPPLRAVSHDAARGGQRADGLHGTQPEGVVPAVAAVPMQRGHHKGHRQQTQQQVEPQLVEFMPYLLPPQGEDEVQQREVHTAEQHGRRQDVLLQGGDAGNAVAIDGEATGGDVGERQVDGIPQLHAARPQSHDEHQRQRQVDRQRAAHGDDGAHGRLAGIVGPRGLGRIERVLVDAQARRQRKNQQHDTEASEPLRHRAPQQHRRRQRRHVGEDRGTRGGDARHGLEPRLGEAPRGPGGEEGQRGEERQHQPQQHHQQVAHAAVVDLRVALVAVPQQAAHGERESGADGRGTCCAVGKMPCRHQAQRHQPTFGHQHDAQEPENCFYIGLFHNRRIFSANYSFLSANDSNLTNFSLSFKN